MRPHVFYLFALCPLPTFAACHWTIYLSPRPSPDPLVISDSQAKLILAHHLGLEESVPPGNEQIVNSWYNLERLPRSDGSSPNGMLVSIESQDPEDFLPAQLRDPSFTVLRAPCIFNLISAYIERASHVYSLIFSSHKVEPGQKHASTPHGVMTDSTSAVAKFKQEIRSMIEFTEGSSELGRFGAFEIKSIALLADEYGRESDEYLSAVRTLKEILNRSVSSRHNLALIVISSSLNTRAPPASAACAKLLCTGLEQLLHKTFPPIGLACKVTLGGESIDILVLLLDTFNCVEQGGCILICSAISGTQTQDFCSNLVCPAIGFPPGSDFSGACSRAVQGLEALALPAASLVKDALECIISKIPCHGKPCIFGCSANEICLKGCCVSSCSRPCPLNKCLVGETCSASGCCQKNCLKSNSICKLGTSSPGFVPCCTGQCTSMTGNPSIGQCPSTCLNIQTDPNNCGCCGTVCPSGVICSGGKCGGAHPVQPIAFGAGCTS